MMIAAPLSRNIKTGLKTAGVYYSIIIAVFFILPFFGRLLPFFSFNSNGGFEACTMVFMFIMGLVSVKSNLKTGIALSRGRTTIVLASALSLVAMSLVTSVADALLNPLAHLIHNQIDAMGLVFELYGVESFWVYLAWRFLLYTFLSCGGFFLASLNYRMNKPLRWAFWIAVPSLLFIVLPIVAVADQGGFAYWLGMAFYNCFAKSVGNCCISFTVLSIAAIALSYLILRKAPIDRE